MSSEYSKGQEATKVDCIANYECEIGENPLWHPLEKRLYWCDIPNGRIFRYDPVSGIHEKCYEGRTVGGFTFQSDGSLLLFMDRGTIANWHKGRLTEVLGEIKAERSSRFNDVIADPRGRVFCGTMSSNERKGSLYRLDTDGSLHVVLNDIGCSNGMAFSLDHKTFYYTDSFAHEIYTFDYNVEDGTITNRRIFASIPESEGLPDGATLDAEGHLWSALWDGSCVVRFFPNGKIDEKITFPALKTSSLTFGGENYTDIFVTTAGGNKKQENGSLAGALFHLKSQIRGLPEFFSRIPVPIPAATDLI
jgi:D-xylono/L-arabinono-1,4-lactonase